MAFEYVGKCQRCHTDSGYLDGKKVHTFSGLLFSEKTYRDGMVFCESPVFNKEEKY